MLKKLSVMVPVFFVVGCFPYVYHEQHRVLVTGVDVAATLEIAAIELEEGGFDATLTVWAIRDQIVTVENAKTIGELYFRYIDRIAAERDQTAANFGVWHFAWAISNLYRNGDDPIKAELEVAYLDARKRPESLTKFKDVAFEHISGSKIYMGDIHGAARSFARAHIVAPGNKKYLQSLDQYRANKAKKKSWNGGIMWPRQPHETEHGRTSRSAASHLDSLRRRPPCLPGGSGDDHRAPA